MDFITTDMFLSFAGCITIVAILTQTIKGLPGLDKINSAWSALFCSTVVGIMRLIFLGDYTLTGITIGILNIFIIYLGSIGGYETVKQITQHFTTKQ